VSALPSASTRKGFRFQVPVRSTPRGVSWPGATFSSPPYGGSCPAAPVAEPLARVPSSGVPGPGVFSDAELEACQYADLSISVALSSSRGSFPAGHAALASDRARRLPSRLDLPLLGFQSPPLHRHTHGPSAPASVHDKSHTSASAGSRLVPSMFRPCRFSRLRRLPPSREPRVCCTPQPIMGFTWFRASSRQRRWSRRRRCPSDAATCPSDIPASERGVVRSARVPVTTQRLPPLSPPGGSRPERSPLKCHDPSKLSPPTQRVPRHPPLA